MTSVIKYYCLIIGLVLLSDCFTTAVYGKRGCASFGHSCYGGHGKRSRGMDVPYAIINGYTTDRFLKKHRSDSKLHLPIPNVPSLYESLDRPSNQDLKYLFKKLVRPSSEYQKSHSDLQYGEGRYFNF